MPLITALEPVPGRLGGRILEAGADARFRVSDELCERRGLRDGSSLTAAELASLVREAGAAEAWDRAVHYLSYRPRTCHELRRYLDRHKLAAHADAAIGRCRELGYLDDDRYAETFVRERIRLKPRGRPRLVSELLQRGIDRDTAERAVDSALADEGVSEDVLLRTVAVGRLPALRKLDPARARRRLTAFLHRRGFRAGAIRDLVRELLPDDSDHAGT